MFLYASIKQELRMTHMLGKRKPYNPYHEVAIPFYFPRSSDPPEATEVEENEKSDKLQSAADAQAEVLRDFVSFFLQPYAYNYIYIYVLKAKVCIVYNAFFTF